MNLRTLISAADLAALGDEVVIVDCRKDLADPARAPAAYREAHLPGAVRAELDTDLSDLSRTGLGRHPLPSAGIFAAALARWGWRPGRALVAYDDAGGALAAARLWWMLRLTGHFDVAVLDGGLGAWRAAGLPLHDGEVVATAAEPVALAFGADALVDYAQLERQLADGAICLLDARATPRYRGEVEPIDARAGHVPGARSRPFGDNLGADGRFREAGALRADLLRVIDGFAPEQVVHMCGSGVTACHNLLAMEHAGLHGSRVFAPSWSGWIGDASRAVATGG